MKPPEETLRVTCSFPAPDLLSSLVHLYFTYPNMLLPILHRPTFEKAIAKDLHHQDVQFAATVLLVCAIGVRFSQDPRVTVVPSDHADSLAWIWFAQSQEMHSVFLYRPSLYVIQNYCVSCLMLHRNYMVLNGFLFSCLQRFWRDSRLITIVGP